MSYVMVATAHGADHHKQARRGTLGRADEVIE
jgi:hypothetical protein